MRLKVTTATESDNPRLTCRRRSRTSAFPKPGLQDREGKDSAGESPGYLHSPAEGPLATVPDGRNLRDHLNHNPRLDDRTAS